MLNQLTKESFEQHLNTTFAIQFEEEVQLDAELIEVSTKYSDPTWAKQPFSILLKTNQTDQYYQQGTFNVSHAAMDDFAIFLTPLGPREGGMLYEAVFG